MMNSSNPNIQRNIAFAVAICLFIYTMTQTNNHFVGRTKEKDRFSEPFTDVKKYHHDSQ